MAPASPNLLMRMSHMQSCQLSLLNAFMMSSMITGIAIGCSNFLMENDYRLSVRTMDLGAFPGNLEFAAVTLPQGRKLFGTEATMYAKYGAVGFAPNDVGIELNSMVFGGLNEVGLSCDVQTLLGTKYPPKSNTSADVGASYLCAWALATCDSVAQMKTLLLNGSVHLHGDLISNENNPIHWVLRDAIGESIVIEFDATTQLQVHVDANDGATGFGILTNEPHYDWHVENVQHLMWKQSLARSSTTIPGTFYPDERYLRIHLIKSAMPQPKSYTEAMMQAVHTLNSITVPMGNQMGTDSGKGEGEGDHTMFGVVYDHKTSTLYFRTQVNQNLQRLRLSDLNLANKSQATRVLLNDPGLPWFDDAANKMTPVTV